MNKWLGVIIACVVIILRLATTHNEGLTVESYAHVNQAVHIQATGFPLLTYTLSGTTTRALFSPVYDYLLAITGSIFGNTHAIHLIGAFIAGLLVLGVFTFILHSTKNSTAAVLASLAAALIPIGWSDILTASSANLGILIGLWILICFLHIDNNIWRIFFLILLVLGVLTSSVILLFLLGLVAYLALAEMARINRPHGEHEFVFFGLLFLLWVYIVLYKDVFVLHGWQAIWQNTPTLLRNSYFSDLHTLDVIVSIGIFPFIGGMYVMYRHLFVEHERPVYFIMSLVLSTGILTWAQIVTPTIGLRVLSIGLVVLFGFAARDILHYLRTTKLGLLRHGVPLVAVLLLLVSSIPATDEVHDAKTNTVTPDELAAMHWIRENTPEHAVIAASWTEGILLSSQTGRTPIMNDQFLLQPESTTRIEDIHTILAAPFQSDVIDALNKYNADFVLWTEVSRAITGRDSPIFATDLICFTPLFTKGSVIVYGIACGLERDA